MEQEEDFYVEFIKAVPGEELTMILRVHLLTEYYLERVIALYLPKGGRLLKESRFSYAQKLALVRSFGVLRDDLAGSLTALNKVRNKCAHVRNREITMSDVNNIGEHLCKNPEEILAEESCSTRENLLNTLGMLSAGLGALVESQMAMKRTAT